MSWFDDFDEMITGARTRADHLANRMAQMIDSLLIGMPPAPYIQTLDGQLFMFTGDIRQIRPGEFHFCEGQVHQAPASFFPGQWDHVCLVLTKIEAQANPNPPNQHRWTADDFLREFQRAKRAQDRQRREEHKRPTKNQQLARAMRTLGYKKNDQPNPEEVKARYRELAKRHHPDVNPAGAERMKRINTAWDHYTQAMKERGIQL